MTGAVSVPAVPGTGAEARAAGVAPAARVALGATLVLCTAVSLSWLVLGAVAAAAQYVPAAARSVVGNRVSSPSEFRLFKMAISKAAAESVR